MESRAKHLYSRTLVSSGLAREVARRGRWASAAALLPARGLPHRDEFMYASHARSVSGKHRSRSWGNMAILAARRTRAVSTRRGRALPRFTHVGARVSFSARAPRHFLALQRNGAHMLLPRTTLCQV
jgi:hypothetical protein